MKERTISHVDIYDFTLENQHKEILFDLCSDPKVKPQHEYENEPLLTAQQLMNEDCRQMMRFEQTMNPIDNPQYLDPSSNSHKLDSIEETEVTALEDIGVKQQITPDMNDHQSVISVCVYDGVCSRWMENDESKICMICGKQFRLWRPRHHCRMCGRLVCASCSPYQKELVSLGYKKPVRVCTMCHQRKE